MPQVSLCFRCNHRARFLEAIGDKYQPRPRHECGDVKSSKWTCYMYEPTQPATLKVNDGDERPAFAGPMISARMACTGQLDAGMGIGFHIRTDDDGREMYTPYWTTTDS